MRLVAPVELVREELHDRQREAVWRREEVRCMDADAEMISVLRARADGEIAWRVGGYALEKRVQMHVDDKGARKW